jgi:hypothetical protein
MANKLKTTEDKTMTSTTVATYKRESTLWPHANLFYVRQDWTLMTCRVNDYADDLASGIRWYDGETGEDITEQKQPKYTVTLTNNRRTSSKSWDFFTRDEANEFVKSVLNHKTLRDWTRF